MASDKQGYFIGLMSGTSMDGIDVALTDISANHFHCIDTLNYPLPHDIKQQMLALAQPGYDELHRCAVLDNQLGFLFADAVNALLKQSTIDKKNIVAIGSHGQTVRHFPDGDFPYSIQIGNPHIIAQQTGITTVADFRRTDMAAGGQGAPLVPAFHAKIIPDLSDKVILNIGGIANITYMHDGHVFGFDTGVGNMLMDAWIAKHLQQDFDRDGAWALSGKLNHDLLSVFLRDDYFAKKPPKSTGRELFNLDWLHACLGDFAHLSTEDVQHTLLHFTAKSIADAMKLYCAHVNEIVVCGGGAHNKALLRLLAEYSGLSIVLSDRYGVPVDFVEACAFAWLGYQTVNGLPGNLVGVTGAMDAVVMGVVVNVMV